LSYVSVWKPVNDRIVQASRESENEIIGLLLGRLGNDTVIIDDSITGEYQADQNRATLPAGTLALIAEDILSGRIKSNIIGWYHSHTQAGVTFSETDIQTQRILQQFSPYITAIVIDAKTGKIGCFRIERSTGSFVLVPNENVRVFERLEDAVSPWIQVESGDPITPTNDAPQDLASRIGSLPTKVIIIYIVAAIAASLLLVLGFILYRSFSLRTLVGSAYDRINRLIVR
jgi:proteasome lid subunit RPN8/RPN11